MEPAAVERRGLLLRPNPETKFRFEVASIDRPHSLLWRCVDGPPEWQPTSIMWTLTPADDGGTHVRFEHRDWASADGELAACTFTWGRILFALDEYVRTGSATPPFSVY